MTSSSGNTPPPTPRNPLSTPPPPPRKPRRGVRKRRRPPRESRRTTPACIICHRKRPLRSSGLCWSLECALQAAEQGSARNGRTNSQETQHDTTDKLSQPLFLDSHPTETPLFVGQGENVSTTPHIQPQLPRNVQREDVTASSPQFSAGAESSVRDEGEQIDRRSLEEEIERQEKDVDRGESPAAREGSHDGDSEKGDESGQSDGDDKEGIGT